LKAGFGGAVIALCAVNVGGSMIISSKICGAGFGVGIGFDADVEGAVTDARIGNGAGKAVRKFLAVGNLSSLILI
jgi:hypothetical protein